MRPIVPILAALTLSLMPTKIARGQGEPSGAPASSVERAARARIVPGDRIVVKVWREPQLSDDGAIVNERAEIVLPRLGIIPVAAHSPATLRDSLRARYATFLRDPVVDVAVLRRVVVNGEVGRPGVYHVDVTTTLRDVIATAGGVTPNGDAGKVHIVRGDERIPVKRWQVDQSAMADLRSGDQVLVGRRNWFLTNALALAGTLAAVASVLIAFR